MGIRIVGIVSVLLLTSCLFLLRHLIAARGQGWGKNHQPSVPDAAANDQGVPDFFRDTTFNVTFDGYYGYNFNKPAGRINLLRAYDVMSNNSERPEIIAPCLMAARTYSILTRQ